MTTRTNSHEPPMEWLGDYIDGRFIKSERSDGEIIDTSPADQNDVLMRLEYRYDHVGAATEAARKAFRGWARASQEVRTEFLLKLRHLFAEQQSTLAELIARETGKPLWDSETEAKSLVNKIDITIEHSLALVATERIPNAVAQIDGVVRHVPRGVMAVLGPFNFPAHLPNGHWVPALLTGNTVVFKPSELTPAIGQFIAQLFHRAGFPDGVFNLVQGDGETGRRLVADDHVDGILFTGSYETGLKIKQKTVEQYWKLLALEMGGKNATIIWEDADLNKAIYETIIGSFMSSGQRCSGTSRIILHRSIAAPFIDRFHETAKKLTIGYWKENPFMGPLISGAAVEKYLRFQEIASREGAERLMRGKVFDCHRRGHYVTPSICLVKDWREDSVYQKTEIFGPNVAIYTVDSIDEAIRINDSTGFGLAASLFTRSKERYEDFVFSARCGIVNWNRTTNGASSRMPFGGFGKSGNDRPTAHYAIRYCTVPVSSLEDLTEYKEAGNPPGLNFQKI